MRRRTSSFLTLVFIFSLTGGSSSCTPPKSNNCTDRECAEFVESKSDDTSTWICPSGFRLEYRPPPKYEIKTSTSGFKCLREKLILDEGKKLPYSEMTGITCRASPSSSRMSVGSIVGIVMCCVVAIGAIVIGVVYWKRCVKGRGEGRIVEEGNPTEVSARSKSTEPTSAMKTSPMDSTNKRTSDNEDSSEMKKSEKSSKEKRGSTEQRSRGKSKERRGSEEKGKSREERRGSKEKGKSRERRRSNERREGSKREKNEEGVSMDKGRRGIEGGSKESKEGEGKRPRVRLPKTPRGNTLKEAEQAKLNQRKGKLPVPNLAKCETWNDVLFEEILKVWMNFSINERIGFCEQMLRKMNGMIAVQFMRLFQNALFVETDRRVWTKLHECFRLLYAQCEAEYYMNICERMYQTVAASAADKLDKMGWQEKPTDNVDDAYLRYICADLVLFDCQTENIAKLFKLYDEMKFSFVSPLRIAVWTRVVREDDLSNEKMVLVDYLFEESKLPRVKLPNEEYGTKLQHLIYAASTSKENNFTKELWKGLVTEKDITPADLVFVFKGTMIYPSARRRCLDLFMEESFFREKIPSDCPEYKEILRLFANSCVRETELMKIKDHVMADFAFTEADKKSFDFEMLEKRMAGFVKEVPILHATMNKYLIEDRDFLVHKK